MAWVRVVAGDHSRPELKEWGNSERREPSLWRLQPSEPVAADAPQDRTCDLPYCGKTWRRLQYAHLDLAPAGQSPSAAHTRVPEGEKRKEGRWVGDTR